jgi:hypothetical protein
MGQPFCILLCKNEGELRYWRSEDGKGFYRQPGGGKAESRKVSFSRAWKLDTE